MRKRKRDVNSCGSNWTLTKCKKKKIDGTYTRMMRGVIQKSWKQHLTKWWLSVHLPFITQPFQIRRDRHLILTRRPDQVIVNKKREPAEYWTLLPQDICLFCFSLFNGILTLFRLFNTKAILLEEQ